MVLTVFSLGTQWRWHICVCNTGNRCGWHLVVSSIGWALNVVGLLYYKIKKQNLVEKEPEM